MIWFGFVWGGGRVSDPVESDDINQAVLICGKFAVKVVVWNALGRMAVGKRQSRRGWGLCREF